MSEKRTIARPYARAMFAGAKDQAQSLTQLLDVLAVAVANDDIDQAIKNPNVQDAQVVAILVGICEEAAPEALAQFGKDALAQWLQLLSAAKRLDCLPQMASLFADENAEHQGAVDVVVSSAEPLSDSQKDSIIKQLSSKWNKTVNAEYVNDPAILGGVRIQAGDWVLDRSIADKLLRLSEDIQS